MLYISIYFFGAFFVESRPDWNACSEFIFIYIYIHTGMPLEHADEWIAFMYQQKQKEVPGTR